MQKVLTVRRDQLVMVPQAKKMAAVQEVLLAKVVLVVNMVLMVLMQVLLTLPVAF